MQRTDALNSFEKYAPSEWVKLRMECGDLKELLTAVYTRAMQHDCFKHYRPRYEPPMPRGYMEMINKYHDIPKTEEVEKRAKVWRAIIEKPEFAGYLKTKHEYASQNLSDIKFLTEMKEHFQILGISEYVEACELRLMDFRHPGVAA